MTITADMTFGEIALLPEFAGFGEHLMLCRPSTWERMWNKPIVSHMNSDANPYETARVLRGLNRIVELVDDGRQVAYEIWDEADFIRSHWLNRRTTDCVGLIKGYGWLNTVTMEIQYGSNGMPDVGADGMYYNAGRKGSIETMPDTPGLAVWKSGHIGVYIGNGEVIEAMDTRYGVVKTKLQGRGWSHWLEVPGIKYD